MLDLQVFKQNESHIFPERKPLCRPQIIFGEILMLQYVLHLFFLPQRKSSLNPEAKEFVPGVKY